MKHEYYASCQDAALRPLEKEDIELLREWRNNAKESRFLRNVGYITPEMQEQWFESCMADPCELVFAIIDQQLDRVVGSVSLYDLNREEHTAQIGKIQIGDPEAHGKGIGRKALVMAMRIGFQYLQLDKILSSVHPDNIQAHTNDMKVGFRITGQCPSVAGGMEDLIEIDEKAASAANPYYYQIITEDKSHMSDEFFIGKGGRFSKTIGQSDIYNFAGITGDFNPVHIDETAAKDSIFHAQAAHGMLIASFLSTVIGTRMPGPGTVYLKQNLTFVRPTFIGDTITAIVTIRQLLENNRAILNTIVINQKGEVLIAGNASVILPE